MDNRNIIKKIVKNDLKRWMAIKIIFIMIITKISIQYWMIPDTPVLYWVLVATLMYSCNHINFIEQENKGIILLGGILLSIAIYLTYVTQNEFVIKNSWIMETIGFLCLCISSWILLNLIFMLFDWFSVREFFKDIDVTKTGIGSKRRFICIFVFIFITWLPYFLTYYPGLIFGDSLNSIYQSMGLANWNNHFPIFYTLFIKVCMKLGLILGSRNIGYVIYTLIQMIIISSVLSFTICWLRNKGFSWSTTLVIWMYYAFETCFPQHAISMWKDGIFSVFLLFIGIQIFDFVISDGKIIRDKGFVIKTIISAAVVCMFRNNGIYIITFICICLGFYIVNHKENYKQTLEYLFYYSIVIVSVLIITGPVYKAMNIDDDEVEKYGILLQQICRTVVEQGDISDEEYEFLNELLPIEKYTELYTPQLVDSIKWDGNFNSDFLENNQKKFIITWFHLLLKNPEIYVKAYLEMTYQYWSPNVWENHMFEGNIVYGDPNLPNTPGRAQAEVKYCNLLENNWIDTKQLFSITTPMIAVGAVIWLILFIIFYAIIKEQIAFILPLMPCIGGLITLLIATPIGYWPRYMLVIYYMLPIFICMIPIIRKAWTSQNINK